MSDLSKYLKAQEQTHAYALRELQNGCKLSHWSWWEIPQIIGLGMTYTSREYAIKNLAEAKDYLKNDTLAEAKDYLKNDTLRTHLLELCEALLSLKTNDAGRVMGYPDDLKLRSCLTLFSVADPECGTFQAVLDKFFGGKPDERTLQILKSQESMC